MDGCLRDDIMKALGTRMGKKYGIAPRDTEGRNGHIRHEICIHKAGETEAVAICLEEAIMRCIREGLTPDELPGAIIQMYLQEEASQDISRGLYVSRTLEGMVRVRLVNYRANSADLAGRPHRRFLDLAADYYLDMEAATGIDGAAIQVTGKMAADWGITEERLYQLGMMGLSAHGGCQAVEVEDMLRKLTAENPGEMEGIFGRQGQKPEMYVLLSPRQCFGAACLLDTAFLQKVADEKGCDMLIYPSSVHEAFAVPFRDGNGKILSTRDVQEINECTVPRYEWLSNSVYLYDRAKKGLGIFREGRPFAW